MRTASSTAAIFIVTATALFGGQATAQKPLPWLGMGFTWLAASNGQRFIQIQKIAPSGPADRAGLRVGDIVTTMNGGRVDFGDDLELILFLSERKIGERMPFEILRDHRAMKVVVTVGTMPEVARAGFEASVRAARDKRTRAAAKKN